MEFTQWSVLLGHTDRGDNWRESEPCNLLKSALCLRQSFCEYSLPRRTIILWNLPGPGCTVVAQEVSPFLSLQWPQNLWPTSPGIFNQPGLEDIILCCYGQEDHVWTRSLSMLWPWVPSSRIRGHQGRSIQPAWPPLLRVLLLCHLTPHHSWELSSPTAWLAHVLTSCHHNSQGPCVFTLMLLPHWLLWLNTKPRAPLMPCSLDGTAWNSEEGYKITLELGPTTGILDAMNCPFSLCQSFNWAVCLFIFEL